MPLPGWNVKGAESSVSSPETGAVPVGPLWRVKGGPRKEGGPGNEDFISEGYITKHKKSPKEFVAKL